MKKLLLLLTVFFATLLLKAQVNNAPIASDITVSTTMYQPIGINLQAGFVDSNGNTLNFTYGPDLPKYGTFTPTGYGTGVYTPGLGFAGIDSFQYLICDTSVFLPSVLCDTATVYVNTVDSTGASTINHKPIANNDYIITKPTRSININVRANDFDIDMGLLQDYYGELHVTVGGGANPLHGTVSVNPDESIVYIPTGLFPLPITTDTFSYVICDVTTINPQPLCDTAMIMVIINHADTDIININRAPIATNDYVQTIQDSCMRVDVKQNDSDPNGDVFYTCPTVVSYPKNGVVTVDADGSMVYCPTPYFHGQDTFTYCICDIGVPSLCDTALVIISVAPRNDAPIASNIHVSTLMNQPIGVNIRASTVDINGDGTVCWYSNLPSHGSWTPTANGVGVFTPDLGYIGVDSFQYYVGDSSIFLPKYLQTKATVYLTVVDSTGASSINHKPIANNDYIITKPTRAVAIDVKANDFDIDNGLIQNGVARSVLSVTIGGGVVPADGNVSVNPDGTIMFTPVGVFPRFITADTFSYVICDVTPINPQPLCDTAMVVVFINHADTDIVGINRSPIATDDYVQTKQDSCIIVDVKQNDSDPNGDVITTCPTVVSNPKNGTVIVVANGSVIYCPMPYFHGQDTFTYCICDNGVLNLCDTAKLIIHVVASALKDSAVVKNISCFGKNDGAITLNVKGGTLPYIYVWSNGANTDSINKLSVGTYIVTVSDAIGETMLDSFTITSPLALTVAIQLHHNTIQDTLNFIVQGGIPAYNYNWSNGNLTSQNPVVAFGNYCVTVADANGCTVSDCYNVQPCDSCVWPGDADHNGMVDNNDLLPIGLAYDSSGTARPNASLVWEAQFSTDWKDTLVGGINFKHSDCDGNGIVSASDTVAIVQNFSLTHNKTDDQKPWRSGLPSLDIIFSKDTVLKGDTLIADLRLGNVNNPAQNVYGLAFTFNYDAKVVDTSKTQMLFGNSWLGNTTDKIVLRQDNKFGKIKAAVTRIDHAKRSGYGSIGTVQLVITTDNIDGKDLMYYQANCFITDLKVIDEKGNIIDFNEGADSSDVGFISTGIENGTALNNAITLYPNPVIDNLKIVSTQASIEKIEVVTVLGETIMKHQGNNKNTEMLNLSSLSSGVYFIQIKTDRGIAVKRILVN
jgi:hypothetical protein